MNNKGIGILEIILIIAAIAIIAPQIVKILC